ncbi:MAG: hypothetical protein AAGD96_01460, partial [Chloroflexota bacterium]
VITLTATADSGSIFDGWNGAGCTGTAVCVVTISASQSVTATFTNSPNARDLTVTASGDGAGTVTSNPAGIDCGSTCTMSVVEGTMVTLTATPDSGSEFAGWSGSICSGTGVCVVTVSEATTVNAIFDEIVVSTGNFIYLPAIVRP